MPGEPVVYDGLPVGAECVVTESATGGATSTTVPPDGDGGGGDAVLVPAGEPAAVTVTNTFDVAEVRVVKSLTGQDAAEHEGDVFTVELACTRDVDGVEQDVEIPGSPTRTLSAADDWVAVYEDLPQGASCRVTETDAGSADSVTIVADGSSVEADPTAAEPRSAEFDLPVGDDVCRPVAVTNTWSASTGGFGATVGTGLDVTLAARALSDGCVIPGGLDYSGSDVTTPDTSRDTLPWTGGDVIPTILLAVLFLISGCAVATASRRMRGRADPPVTR